MRPRNKTLKTKSRTISLWKAKPAFRAELVCIGAPDGFPGVDGADGEVKECVFGDEDPVDVVVFGGFAEGHGDGWEDAEAFHAM